MSALGHVVGCAAGSVDLVRLLGSALGDSQFKQLTIIAALAMVGSTAVTCCAVTERVPVAPRGSKHGDFVGVLRQIHDTLRNLSPRINTICWAQFWAWIGWFPFLFYSTTWVGETYFRYDAPADRRDARDALGDVGRIGSTSLLIYSAITTAGAFVLPLLVRSPDDSHFTHRPPPALAGLVAWVERHRPDLETTWQCAHVVFAASLFLAPLAQSFRFATALVCFCVLPWTVATWAPPALLGIEINTMSGATARTAGYRPLPSEPVVELSVVQPSRDRREAAANGLEGTGKHGAAELSGIYFGILNIYTALPQFVGAFVASVVFAVLEPGGSPELATDSGLEAVTAADAGGPSAISACLFIGAICALVAAVATRKLKRL